MRYSAWHNFYPEKLNSSVQTDKIGKIEQLELSTFEVGCAHNFNVRVSVKENLEDIRALYLICSAILKQEDRK